MKKGTDKRNLPSTTAAVAMSLLVVAGTGAALVSDTNVQNKILEHEIFEDVSIDDSDITRSHTEDASLDGSHMGMASLEDVTIRESYLNDLSIEDALLEESRVERATLDDVTLHDVTACDVAVNGHFNVGTCHLVDIENGDVDVYAQLPGDAPETIAPGGSYELHVQDAQADTMTLHNDPGGLVGLDFKTAADPLGLQQLGFTAAASNESVESFELIVDDSVVETFGFGETIDLPSDDFTLRVNVAEEGIIDGARLGLVLDLDGHELRPRMTNLEVIAEDLVFLPVADQPFGPFLADDVARLVITAPVDAFGNVDRDVNISMSVDVTAVESGDVELVGDIENHANLHDDSRLFSERPFSYKHEVDAAHHPQSLELLVRANLVEDLPYGAVDAYGTHLVAIGPFPTNVTLTAETTNALGDNLSAELDVAMGATPEEERTFTFLGAEFDLPGRGMLDVRFVDESGAPMQAGAGWTLSIEETPDSHEIRMDIAIDEGADSIQQDLAASKQLQTPLGNFAPSEYQVCVDHDNGRDCANGGDLIAIETGETSSVEIQID